MIYFDALYKLNGKLGAEARRTKNQQPPAAHDVQLSPSSRSQQIHQYQSLTCTRNKSSFENIT